MNLPPMNDEYVDIPWPTRSQLKTKAPGIAVVGRRWLNIDVGELPFLIGQILKDAWNVGNTIVIELTGGVDELGDPRCDLELKGISNELPAIYAFNWENAFERWLKAYIKHNMKNESNFHLLRLYCRNDGDVWESIPRNVHLLDEVE